MKQDKVVRALDVGYGNTKYVAFHSHGQEIQCALFPSVAPQASSGPDLSVGVLQRRNTVVIDVAGVKYEVGKDAKLAQSANFGRVLTEDYSLTDTYLALARGALFYMGLSKIDFLVVGLPVNTVEQFGAKVRARMIGEHILPSAEGDGESTTVVVDDVRVVPQPIGAFFDHSVRNNMYSRMKTQTNLLIDPGYYTLDWVVAHGIKPAGSRSGAHPGGMSAVLAAMGDAISKDLGVQLTDLSGIDEAIRLGTKPRFFGKEMDISEYYKVGQAAAQQGISMLANKVGGGGVDIDNILLAGGGAEFYKPLIQEKFPRHEISIAKDPVFANVRGFQLAGQQWANQVSFDQMRGNS